MREVSDAHRGELDSLPSAHFDTNISPLFTMYIDLNVPTPVLTSLPSTKSKKQKGKQIKVVGMINLFRALGGFGRCMYDVPLLRSFHDVCRRCNLRRELLGQRVNLLRAVYEYTYVKKSWFEMMYIVNHLPLAVSFVQDQGHANSSFSLHGR